MRKKHFRIRVQNFTNLLMVFIPQVPSFHLNCRLESLGHGQGYRGGTLGIGPD